MISAIFVIALSAAVAEDAAGMAWLRKPPSSDPKARWVALLTKDAYEVVASMEPWAVSLLETKPILPLSEAMARSLAGGHFVAEPGKKPYLLRAVCGHGATGGYSLRRRGNQLLIAHGSLGHHSRYHRSAFVINFETPPEELYLTVSIAE